jgi:hypothetical protein
MNIRPSTKELNKKIREAREIIATGRIQIVGVPGVAADALELDYDIETELTGILLQILNIITPAHYRGGRPPQRSYETEIVGLDLYAFAVKFPRLNGVVYIKFALADDIFWLVSLHKDRPAKEDV